MEPMYQSNEFIQQCAIELINTYKESYHTNSNIQPHLNSIFHNPLFKKRGQINLQLQRVVYKCLRDQSESGNVPTPPGCHLI